MFRMLGSFLIFSSLRAFAGDAATCYKMDVESVLPNIKSMTVVFPPEVKKIYYMLEVTAKDRQNKAWSNEYFCAKATGECAGDDDSGHFIVETTNSSLTMTLKYINLGDADEPGPELRPLQAKSNQIIEGKITPCFFGNKAL